MRKLMMLGLLGLAPVGAAYAAPLPTVPTQITYTPSSYALYTTTAVFEAFNTTGTFTAGTPATGVTESATASYVYPAGTTSAQGKPLPTDSTSYLSILAGGSFTVNFASAVQVFSFDLGTLDSFNKVVLNFADGSQDVYNGLGIVGSTDSSLIGSYGRVTYDAKGGSGIISAVLSSTSDSFEIDDLASAAPEPATWALMILGFGLIGSQLRMRRRKGVLAAA